MFDKDTVISHLISINQRLATYLYEVQTDDAASLDFSIVLLAAEELDILLVYLNEIQIKEE